MKAFFALLSFAQLASGAVLLSLGRDRPWYEESPKPRNASGPRCNPRCDWDCGTPECTKSCKAVCQPPVCQTSCKKASSSECRHVCKDPQCKVVCPAQKCHSLHCPPPQCDTVCGEPECMMSCGEEQECETQCADPVCSFDCKMASCAERPECKLTCPKAPEGCKQPNLGDELPLGFHRTEPIPEPEAETGSGAAAAAASSGAASGKGILAWKGVAQIPDSHSHEARAMEDFDKEVPKAPSSEPTPSQLAGKSGPAGPPNMRTFGDKVSTVQATAL